MSNKQFKTSKDLIRTVFTLPETHRKWLRHTAFHAGISMSKLLRNLINHAIKNKWEVECTDSSKEG